jgi:hypothetical protein
MKPYTLPSSELPRLKTAAGLKRLTFAMRLWALLPENPNNSGSRPWSGVCLLASQ